MKLGAVIVTYNRLEKLKIALKAYEDQTYLPTYIIVVNNNSNDGTKEYLDKWASKKAKFEKIIIHLDKNTGGSGGFYTGLKKALELDASFVWVADDDAYPYKDAFSIANEKLKKLDIENISAICGQVITQDKIDLEHRRYTNRSFLKIRQVPIPLDDYDKESFELDQFSYVGTFLNVEKMKKVGLPNKDYFIYFDDTEHSLRMARAGKRLCYPAIKVNHDTPLNVDTSVSWKSYYGTRNRLYSFKNLYPKRYYRCIYLKVMFLCNIKLLFKKNIKENRLYKTALKDAK